MLMDTLRVMVNNPFKENFMGKEKKKKTINIGQNLATKLVVA